MAGRRTLVLASRNPDKIREMTALFADLPLGRLTSAREIEGLGEVVEDGDTLEANALKKAREIAEATGELCLADDTGLEVDALDGAPGVYAARYAGEECSYEDNWRKLLRELENLPEPQRTACFRTVMALVDPAAGVEITVEGVLEGFILEAPRGEGGFGYDPVFFVPEAGQTLAEMPAEEKNRLSHRARAAQAMHETLREYLGAKED